VCVCTRMHIVCASHLNFFLHRPFLTSKTRALFEKKPRMNFLRWYSSARLLDHCESWGKKKKKNWKQKRNQDMAVFEGFGFSRVISNPSNTAKSGALGCWPPFSPIPTPSIWKDAKEAGLFYFYLNRSRILPTEPHFVQDSGLYMIGKCQRSASLLFLYEQIRINLYRSRREALLWHFPNIQQTESRPKCGCVGRIRDPFIWK